MRIEIKKDTNMPEDPMKDHIISLFPDGWDSRQLFPGVDQADIICLLFRAFKNGHKNVILQAPTGIGKSVISYVLMQALSEGDKSYFISTPELVLMAQYKADFQDLADVRGRPNFICAQDNKTNASKAACTFKHNKFKCDKKIDCEYEIQKNLGESAIGCLTNTAYIFRVQNTEAFPTRPFGVIDECHLIPNVVLSMSEVTIKYRDWENWGGGIIPDTSDKDEWKTHITRMMLILKKKVKSHEMLEDMLNAKDLSAVEKLLDDMMKLQAMIGHDFVQIFHDQDNFEVVFKPVSIGGLTKYYIKKYADNILLMSATAGSPSKYGLRSEDCFYIDIVDSPFSVENRPLYYMPCGSMSAKSKEKTFPIMLEKIVKIAELRPDTRGIIITSSHWNRERIAKHLSDEFGDRVITHGRDNFQQQWDNFLTFKSKPLIFVTTRHEGLDLPGKLAEWLIFTKVPYPYLSEYILARMRYEQDRYLVKMPCDEFTPVDGLCDKSSWCGRCCEFYSEIVADKITQAMGRIIRSKNDVGEIFILDSAFGRFLGRWKSLFPKYILEAIMRINSMKQLSKIKDMRKYNF